jgi:hypothetical protein
MFVVIMPALYREFHAVKGIATGAASAAVGFAVYEQARHSPLYIPARLLQTMQTPVVHNNRDFSCSARRFTGSNQAQAGMRRSSRAARLLHCDFE